MLENFAQSLAVPELKKLKPMKSSTFDDLDKVLFSWFSQNRSYGLPISGPMVQFKAQQLHKKLYGDDGKFSVSNGWLQGFKNRHGIRELLICGEILYEAAKDYVLKFPEIVFGYSLQLIFNAGESGLIFKALPEKSLASKVEDCAPGFKMNKQRLTIMACTKIVNYRLW